MLVSPNVLFIAEGTEPDPAHPGHQRLDAFSLATRMSLFLWDSVPDDNVLKAAESGEVQTPKGRARVIDMMLSSRRLDAGVRAFFDDMFGFDDFVALSKDPMMYPQFTGQVATDAREQTLRTIVDHLVTKRGDYRDLFTTRETFISPALAVIYGEPAPSGWTPYTEPADSPRAGLLSQISFLSLHSHPTRSSPTLRGKALRELLLCQRVPPPPPNVDFSAVDNPNSPFNTQRERVAFHLKNPVCAGCHKVMDPMGLALENFDGVGRWRDKDRQAEVRIDASGVLPDGAKVNGPVDLRNAIMKNPDQFVQTLTTKLMIYATGRPMEWQDMPTIRGIVQTAAKDNYRFASLVTAIVNSAPFRMQKIPAEKDNALQAAVIQ